MKLVSQTTLKALRIAVLLPLVGVCTAKLHAQSPNAPNVTEGGFSGPHAQTEEALLALAAGTAMIFGFKTSAQPKRVAVNRFHQKR